MNLLIRMEKMPKIEIDQAKRELADYLERSKNDGKI